ncbi:MAG: bifunctional precorrin-2 dehydrogenase/sirohydrochlorin ferrochelatase [Salibacteraceae bacterium]
MQSDQNELYPVFLRLDRMRLLIIGGGAKGSEKLRFLLKSSPNARVELVAPSITEEIGQLADAHPGVILHRRPFSILDLNEKDVVIVATEDAALDHRIWEKAKYRKLLVHVADVPHLSDFYLGSVVTKGDIKIAVSTNGKSPTFSRRVRELLEEVLPEEIPIVLAHLRLIRDRLKSTGTVKVRAIRELTSAIVGAQHLN